MKPYEQHLQKRFLNNNFAASARSQSSIYHLLLSFITWLYASARSDRLFFYEKEMDGS